MCALVLVGVFVVGIVDDLKPASIWIPFPAKHCAAQMVSRVEIFNQAYQIKRVRSTSVDTKYAGGFSRIDLSGRKSERNTSPCVDDDVLGFGLDGGSSDDGIAHRQSVNDEPFGSESNYLCWQVPCVGCPDAATEPSRSVSRFKVWHHDVTDNEFRAMCQDECVDCSLSISGGGVGGLLGGFGLFRKLDQCEDGRDYAAHCGDSSYPLRGDLQPKKGIPVWRFLLGIGGLGGGSVWLYFSRKRIGIALSVGMICVGAWSWLIGPWVK